MESMALCANTKKRNILDFPFSLNFHYSAEGQACPNAFHIIMGVSNDIRAFKTVYALYVWIYNVGGKGAVHGMGRGFKVLVRTHSTLLSSFC